MVPFVKFGRFQLPLITWPTPIWTVKSPRPTEESNLLRVSDHAQKRLDRSDCVLVALVVGLGGVLEPASVLNGDALANLSDGAGALLDDGLGNTHDD